MDNSPIISDYRYLVIDDDRFTCDCLVKLFNKHGIVNVETMYNGKSAVSWFNAAKTSPDIIICDLNMPEFDGVEYVLYLAEKNFTGGIILMSSTAMNLLNAVKDLAKAHKLNVLAALPKPINPDALLALLSQFAANRNNVTETIPQSATSA
jgi:CheY-like chemotaxis protein